MIADAIGYLFIAFFGIVELLITYYGLKNRIKNKIIFWIIFPVAFVILFMMTVVLGSPIAETPNPWG